MFGWKKNVKSADKQEENVKTSVHKENAAAQAYKDGSKKGRLMVARKMKAKGRPVEQIAFACKLTLEEVEEA